MRTLLAFLGAFVVLVGTTSIVHAEHRVALLIGNSAYDDDNFVTPKQDLRTLANRLSQYGVRCTLVENVAGKELKSRLEAFANSTPTRGTALVYFSGQVRPGNYKGKDATFLVGTDAKNDARSIGNAGYSLDVLLETMRTEGGSSTNVVIVDSASGPPESKPQVPKDCMLAYVQTQPLIASITGTGELLDEVRKSSRWAKASLDPNVKVAGKGSAVVAPPEKFVLGNTAGDEWVNSRGTVFCWCPPGSYTAGSPESTPGRYSDEQQRKVDIEHGFWIAKYEMTLRENLRNHPRKTIAKHKNDPLTMVHHDDGKTMLSRTLTAEERKKGRLPNDWEYTLPTEDQWEYAARAGTTTRFYFGDDLQQLPRHANFGDKSYYDSKDIFSNAAHRTLDDGHVRLAIVGSYAPNPWGLHDIYGNVAEWCINTAIRGGSWVSSAENCRSAYRDAFSSRNEQNFIGYRLVIQPRTAKKK